VWVIDGYAGFETNLPVEAPTVVVIDLLMKKLSHFLPGSRFCVEVVPIDKGKESRESDFNVDAMPQCILNTSPTIFFETLNWRFTWDSDIRFFSPRASGKGKLRLVVRVTLRWPSDDRPSWRHTCTIDLVKVRTQGGKMLELNSYEQALEFVSLMRDDLAARGEIVLTVSDHCVQDLLNAVNTEG
jgi:hypothetical protein